MKKRKKKEKKKKNKVKKREEEGEEEEEKERDCKNVRVMEIMGRGGGKIREKKLLERTVWYGIEKS